MIAAQRTFSVIQIAYSGIVEQIESMPRITRAIGHHTNRVSINMQTVRIGLDHHALPGSVAEHPVQRRYCSHHGHRHQRQVVFEHLGCLVYALTLGKQMIDQHGRLDGFGVRPR